MAIWGLAATLLSAAIAPPAANASETHAGYYYPTPQTQEVYVSASPVNEHATPRSRAAFAVGMADRQSKLNYPPDFHLFVKGENLEKLIIVAVGSNRYNTLYRLRALLASMTALARGSPMFAQATNPHRLNFFDFCKMMGFTQITVTDGDRLAHRILIR